MSSQRSSGGVSGRGHHGRRRRDAALERTRSITKTVGVASVAAVAVFGIYLSRALPGHAATSTGTGSAGTGAAVTPSTAAPSDGSGSSPSPSPTQLTPPTSPPVQAQQRQAPVVSGSS